MLVSDDYKISFASHCMFREKFRNHGSLGVLARCGLIAVRDMPTSDEGLWNQ